MSEERGRGKKEAGEEGQSEGKAGGGKQRTAQQIHHGYKMCSHSQL